MLFFAALAHAIVVAGHSLVESSSGDGVPVQRRRALCSAKPSTPSLLLMPILFLLSKKAFLGIGRIGLFFFQTLRRPGGLVARPWTLAHDECRR